MYGLSKGKQAFNGCQVKQVTFLNPQIEALRYSAKVECPGLGEGQSITSDGENYTSQGAARRNLARVAGATACRNCAFATMDQAGADNYQAEQARAKANLLQGKTELARAQHEHDQALAEIQRAVQGTQQPELATPPPPQVAE